MSRPSSSRFAPSSPFSPASPFPSRTFSPSRSLSSAAAFVVLFGLVAEGARAQSVDRHELNRVRFNRADCESGNVLLDIELSGLTVGQRYWRTERLMAPGTAGDCSYFFEAGEEELSTILPTEEVLFSGGVGFLESERVSTRTLLPEAACEGTGERRTEVSACLYVLTQENPAIRGDVVLRDGIAITYDTEVPAPPTVSGVQTGDGRLRFTVEADDSSGDNYDYLVQYRPCTAVDAGPADDGGPVDDGDAGGEERDAGVGAEDAGIEGIDAGFGGDAGLGDGDAGFGADAGLGGDAGLGDGDAGIGSGTDDGGAGLGDGGTGGRDPDGETGGIEADSTCGSPYDFTERRFEDADIVLDGLENDVEYEVRVVLEDDFENRGEPSEVFLATPRTQLGPLDLYNGAGSPYSFTPSCGAVEGGTFALGGLALVLLVFRRRRRAKAGGALLGALVVTTSLASPSARADLGDLTLGLHVGPYAPAIDSELVDGERIFPIYDCFFESQLLPELGFQVGVELFDAFGTLEVGLHTTVSQARGKTQPLGAIDPETGVATCREPSNGNVELTILKLRPGVTYRFDPLLDWVGVPLVPYGRVGFVAAGYGFSSEGLFDQSTGEGVTPPLGVVFGYEGALGLQLALGFLDQLDPFTPRTAQRAQALGVFEHAFLFGELLYQDIQNFGQPGFVFSPEDRLFNTGLPITVHFGIALELP